MVRLYEQLNRIECMVTDRAHRKRCSTIERATTKLQEKIMRCLGDETDHSAAIERCFAEFRADSLL